jgi:hypothetical protein
LFPLFATGANNKSGTGGKFADRVVDTGGNFATSVTDNSGTLTCEYLRKFLTKFKMTLTLFLGAWGRGGEVIHKKPKQESSDTVPLSCP